MDPRSAGGLRVGFPKFLGPVRCQTGQFSLSAASSLALWIRSESALPQSSHSSEALALANGNSGPEPWPKAVGLGMLYGTFILSMKACGAFGSTDLGSTASSSSRLLSILSILFSLLSASTNDDHPHDDSASAAAGFYAGHPMTACSGRYAIAGG